MSSKLTKFNNPLYQGQDPFIVKKDGYYIFVSSSNDDSNTNIFVSKSKSLIEQGEKIAVFDSKGKQKRIFAPEIFFINGKWYIYYCADFECENWRHMAGCLESVTDDPQGEYIDRGPLFTGEDGVNQMANDFTVVDWKGQLYAIWGTLDEHECLGIAPMDTPSKITANRSFLPKYHGEGPRAITDGNVLYITSSQGPYANKDYHLGAYIYEGKGDILDKNSWRYEDNWFNHTDDVYGPARACFVKSMDDSQDIIMYHSKVYEADCNGWRQVNIQPFTWKDGKPDFGRPVSPYEFQDLPSGDPGIGDVYFADEAELYGGKVENDHKGCQGSGYVNISAETNEKVTFSVDVPSEDDYFIRFRYAYGVKYEQEYTSDPRTQHPRMGQLDMVINGEFSQMVEFEKTDITWDSWMFVGRRIHLKAGKNDITLQVKTPDRANINLNYISIDTF